MNRKSRIRASLAVAAAACFAALAMLVPVSPAASDSGECRLPAWIEVWTGHWGGTDCR